MIFPQKFLHIHEGIFKLVKLHFTKKLAFYKDKDLPKTSHEKLDLILKCYACFTTFKSNQKQAQL